MIQTHLEIQVHRGQRQDAIAALEARRIFEECAEAVDGFLGGELLLPEDEPDTLYIIARWQTRDAAMAWLASPVRAAQNSDLSPFVSKAPVSRIMVPTGYAFPQPDPKHEYSIPSKKGPDT